jgi:hypothetical protein
MSIDYTKIDQTEIQQELISYLKSTSTFKHVDVKGTAFNDLINLLSYNASLFGFYLNQIANEPFLDSAKLYKNLNRISNNLRYNPRGKASAVLEILVKLSKNYVLSNNEGYIEIPAYSKFPCTTTTSAGENFSFTNPKPLIVPIKQFGVKILRRTDLKYTGTIGDSGALINDRLVLLGTPKNPISIISGKTVIGEVQTDINSRPSDTLVDFMVDTEYSLVIVKNNDQSFNIVIYPATVTPLSDEILKFKVLEDRSIQITKNYSVNKIYKGRLGVRNYEYINFNAVVTSGRNQVLSRLQMIIKRFSPTVEFLINGTVYSFSDSENDIVISTDEITTDRFVLNKDLNIILAIKDSNAKNYGAVLELKSDDEMLETDVAIARIPVNVDTLENGTLKILDNEFLKGEAKNGYIVFEEGETKKRVVFKTPYDIGDGSTTTIASDSDKNYSIFLSPEGNAVCYFSEKKTTGFTINVEPGSGFTGKVLWKTVGYERIVVEEEIQDLTNFQTAFDITSAYSVMVQPQLNANVWVSDTGSNGFKISSDISFTGDVDFLIIPESEFENAGDFSLANSVYVGKNETQISVNFVKPRLSSDYRVFLQANGNVRVWAENKSINGFLIRIEEDTDFYGKIEWQIHESALSGTITFRGGSIASGQPVIEYLDVMETSRLGAVEQGLARLTVIDQNGVIDQTSNGLQLAYNTEIGVYKGLSFTINDSSISYNNIRAFVKINEKWVEFVEANKYNSDITPDSKVFHVRVNKDKLVTVKFGDNDNRGFNPINNQIAIIGMSCVGIEGNISDGVLDSRVVGSLNFDTRNKTPLKVEKAFIDLLKIKHEMFFNNKTYSSLIDYNNNMVSATDMEVVQLGVGMFGSEPEAVEELRNNSQQSYYSQKRMVAKSDYKTLLLKEFSDIVVDIEVFNFEEAKRYGLIPKDSSQYNSNTLFFLSIPLYGTKFSLTQIDSIYSYINERTLKHATTGAVIIEPSFVPIDVLVLYQNKVDFSPIESRNDIVLGVNKFFDRRYRKLGETITTDAIRNSISLNTINSLSMQLNKDPNNDFSSADYDVDITSDQYADTFKEVQDKKLKDVINSELRNLLDKNLIQINQPLFDIESPDGSREWIYSGEVVLGRFEFPILGDIVLERRV